MRLIRSWPMRRSLLEPRWLSYSIVLIVAVTAAGLWLRQGPPESVGSRTTGYRVDVNHASEIELAALPGLGPSTARRIIESRNESGRFETPDDLTRVRGIGAGRVKQMRAWIICGPGVATAQAGVVTMDAKKNSGPHDEPLFIEITRQDAIQITP
jgi:competence ComEA-like helix-hairpin-helix protein